MIVRRIVPALVLLIAACGGGQVTTSGCEWVPAPPPPNLCMPGDDPAVDENLVADCTALTKPMGDWLLGLDQLGRENCDW